MPGRRTKKKQAGTKSFMVLNAMHYTKQAIWQNEFGAGYMKRWLTNTYISAISRKSRLGDQSVHVV